MVAGYRPGKPARVRFARQRRNRYRDERWIAELRVPVHERALRRRSDGVNALGRAKRGWRTIRLEDVQDLRDRDSARRGRRHRDERIAAVGAANRPAQYRTVSR